MRSDILKTRTIDNGNGRTTTVTHVFDADADLTYLTDASRHDGLSPKLAEAIEDLAAQLVA